MFSALGVSHVTYLYVLTYLLTYLLTVKVESPAEIWRQEVVIYLQDRYAAF